MNYRHQYFCTLLCLCLWLNISSAFLASPSPSCDSAKTRSSASLALQAFASNNQKRARNSSSSSVKVFDNVVSAQACKFLHKLTLEHSSRSHDGSSIFYRGKGSEEQRMTPIETTIDQILTSLNDTSPMVEYWSRSKYINLDAHADIDENTLKDDGVLRCPKNGHVLYMQIANSNKNVAPKNEDENFFEDIENNNNRRMGPTVVFPNRKIAWGTVTPRTLPSPSLASFNSEANLKERVREYIVDVENYWSEEEKQQNGYQIDDDDSNKEEMMAIVPAVDGRLLRFDGDAFHSVPKPPDRYLLSEKQLNAYLDRECEESDEFAEYEWHEGTENLRSVLLFNTWPEGSSGPRGVLPDRIVDDVPDGIVIEGDSDDNSGEDGSIVSREEERWQEWQDEYGDNFENLYCNPIEEWNCLDANHCDDDLNDVKISLMGNPTRRGVPMTKAMMRGPVDRKLFHDSHVVSMVTLEESLDYIK